MAAEKKVQEVAMLTHTLLYWLWFSIIQANQKYFSSKSGFQYAKAKQDTAKTWQIKNIWIMMYIYFLCMRTHIVYNI